MHQFNDFKGITGRILSDIYLEESFYWLFYIVLHSKFMPLDSSCRQKAGDYNLFCKRQYFIDSRELCYIQGRTNFNVRLQCCVLYEKQMRISLRHYRLFVLIGVL